MIEVWMRDEYGQSSIQGRYVEVKMAVKKSQDLLESINSDNALTYAEKERNWECYVPICSDELFIYGGKTKGSIDTFFNPDTGEKKELKSANIFLGKRSGSDWFAADHKNVKLASLDDKSLGNKSFIFFKKV